jgi:sec-independent protein translocase protein TatA
MNVFGIGLPEMALIMVIALLVFGPKKLPEIGRSLGKAIRGFQDASKEFESEFKREAEQLEQVAQNPTLPEAKPAANQEALSTESNNHVATSSQP